MAQLGGGRSDHLEFEDEFEEAFARLTAPMVKATAPVVEATPDTACGLGAPPPPVQTSTVCAPETPAADEPPREAPESAAAESAAEATADSATMAEFSPEAASPTSAATAAGPRSHEPVQEGGSADTAESAGPVVRFLGATLPFARRASSRSTGEGLRYLFPTARAFPRRPPAEVPPTDAGHSPYYRAFIRGMTHKGPVIPTGWGRLDGLLGGGFHPGLHLLSGHRPRMRRAFLDNVMWGAVEQKRPVWYYALDTGTQAVWERMVVTLSSLLGEPLRAEELHAPTDVDDVMARVGEVDSALVRNVLPYVWLRDPVGTDHQDPNRFVAGVEANLLREEGPRLLLIDSLFRTVHPQLGGVTGEEVRLADEFDRLLRRRSSVAVAAVSSDLAARLMNVGRGHLRLAEFGGLDAVASENVVVTAHKDGRVKSDIFAIDRVTGLLG